MLWILIMFCNYLFVLFSHSLIGCLSYNDYAPKNGRTGYCNSLSGGLLPLHWISGVLAWPKSCNPWYILPLLYHNGKEIGLLSWLPWYWQANQDRGTFLLLLSNMVRRSIATLEQNTFGIQVFTMNCFLFYHLLKSHCAWCSIALIDLSFVSGVKCHDKM